MRMLRPFTPADQPHLLHIFRSYVPQFFGAEEEADFIKFLINEADHYFVYQKGNRIAGAGGYAIKGRTGRLAWYLTDDEFRGQGIGRALVQHSLDALKHESGIDQIQVRTSQHANVFFGHFGFETKAVVSDYWSKGLDLYDMFLDEVMVGK